MAFRYCILLLICLSVSPFSWAEKIVPGAEALPDYLPLLKGKRVALLINQTSRVGNQLLADTLLKRGVRLVRIFVPEHGFRGVGDAGVHIENGKDSATGLDLVSLYGNNKKPKAEQLKDVDVVIYDLQDVGTRFYTYISTLQYMMEACAENGKQLLILDRPNPNGYYVDGPVLDTALRSFVGMQPIPIVYGMTPGEYAGLLVGERWFKGAEKLRLNVIRCKGWNHHSRYALPVSPSPNLRNGHAIALYPSLCLFEGTAISVGRGTSMPFEQLGHPDLQAAFRYSFIPMPNVGASKPRYSGQVCYGVSLSGEKEAAAINVEYLIQFYKAFPNKDAFFNDFFEKLAGTRTLRTQIRQGISAAAIRESWQPGLAAFKKIRKKYLLYKDFE